jgi:outer membrane lipoprotein-sorting protein
MHTLPFCAVKRLFPGTCLLFLVISFASDLLAGLSPPQGDAAAGLIARMEAAYAQVAEYQTETEVSEYRDGRVIETRRFRYAFKKPHHVRIDMESPYRGMILVYPDENGKVAVTFGFLKLRLSPGSALLRSSTGQRIDQTDLGLLIRNITHSLTDRRRGEIKVSGQEDRLLIEVLAEDHFRAGDSTLYRFSIDTTRSLPMEVDELSPDGILRRRIIFRNLQTSNGIPDSLFRIDGRYPGHGQPGK